MHLILIYCSFIFWGLYLHVYRLLIVKAEVVVFYSFYSFFNVKLSKFLPTRCLPQAEYFFESFSAVLGNEFRAKYVLLMLICLTTF